MFYSRNLVTFSALLGGLLVGVNAFPTLILDRQAANDSSHWVDTWTSMPQLVEPDNLPPSPFV